MPGLVTPELQTPGPESDSPEPGAVALDCTSPGKRQSLSCHCHCDKLSYTSSDAPPQTLYKDIVQVSLPSMLTLIPRSSSRPQKASLNWLPWSVLKISAPLLKASFRAAIQKPTEYWRWPTRTCVPVHNGHEIKESPGHQVGNVGCPNLIDPVEATPLSR